VCAFLSKEGVNVFRSRLQGPCCGWRDVLVKPMSSRPGLGWETEAQGRPKCGSVSFARRRI
jgi:hypothetical protein